MNWLEKKQFEKIFFKKNQKKLQVKEHKINNKIWKERTKK